MLHLDQPIAPVPAPRVGQGTLLTTAALEDLCTTAVVARGFEPCGADVLAGETESDLADYLSEVAVPVRRRTMGTMSIETGEER